MKCTTLFSLLMNLPACWDLLEIIPNLDKRTLTMKVRAASTATMVCPECGRPIKMVGRNERSFRWPFDVLNYETNVVVVTPKAICEKHGEVDASSPMLTKSGDSRVQPLIEGMEGK